jgi:2-keto-3-deoxy-L-rhamnonate aldolase RhmA
VTCAEIAPACIKQQRDVLKRDPTGTRKEREMKRRFALLVFYAALGVGALHVLAQESGNSRQAGQANPAVDPDADRGPAGATKFPLAAPAGKDSGATTKAPPGAVNQGAVDEKTWKYGHRFDPPPNAKIWNPVKLKLMRGEKVTGGTVSAASDPSTYCAMANAGYDFIWTEMQHSPRGWENVAKMWEACPHAKAVPGVRVAYANEREIQHAMDEGALVVVIPTVRTFDEGVAGRDWTYFPPVGKRSQGAGQAYSAAFWGNVPGGYRNTINDNVVLIEMIETVGGAAQAREIASIPGVDALFAASSDLGNFSGYKQGDPDYERLINVVHDAALAAGKRLCGPLAWRDRPDFTCFQAGSETAAIDRGVATELGDLKDTQGKPEVGPFAKP